jgi:hypothetical protein
MAYLDFWKDKIAKVDSEIKETVQALENKDLNRAVIEHLRQREHNLRQLELKLYDEISEAFHSLQQNIPSSSAS